jgi:APA family basic amino acid/polyamine antiporter
LARLSRRFPKAGGPYIYSREAFGDFVAFQMAWSYWVGAWAGNAAIATAFVSALSYFWPILAHNNWLAFLVAAGAVWLFTLLNALSVRAFGAVQIIFVIIKVIPLIAIGISGLFWLRLDAFFVAEPVGQSIFHIVASASALTLFAFLGLESATIPADNVINPRKTIPRATVLGTLFAAVIYLWTTVVLFGLIPPQRLASSPAPFADAAILMFGPSGAWLIALCVTLSAFGTLNGWILLQGQMPLVAANDGLFPPVFARQSRFGTPAFALVFSSLLMTGVLYLNFGAGLVQQFTSVVTLTTFAVLVPFLYATAADLKLLLRKGAAKSKRQLWAAVLVNLCAFTYTLFIVVGSGQEAVYLGTLFIFLGFPLYAVMKRNAHDEMVQSAPR